MDFFQDSKGVSDDTINNSKPPRKTSDLINSVEITRRMSSGSSKNVEIPVKSRSSSITSSEQKEITSYDNKGQDLESDTTSKEQLEDTGLNRRSASWLLTENRRVRSIRDLLRPDLWDSKRPNIRPSNSFRSDISDSDMSCTDSVHGNGLNCDLSENSSLSSYESRGSAPDRRRDSHEEIGKNGTRRKFTNGKTEQHSSESSCGRGLPKRKISSTSNGLPEISENVFSEMTFLPKDQIKYENQRRSLRADHNNNLRTPSPRRTNSEGSKPTGKVFDNNFADVSSTSSSHTGSSCSSQNGDAFEEEDYLTNS